MTEPLSRFVLDPQDVQLVFEKKFATYTTGFFQQLNSLENRVFEIETEDRLGNRARKILKFYRPGRWTKEMILEEHLFLNKLLELDLNVVAPEKDDNGETLFEIGILGSALDPQSSITYWCCFPKVGGYVDYEPSPEKLQILGRQVGKIHYSSLLMNWSNRKNFWQKLDLVKSFDRLQQELSQLQNWKKFENHFQNLFPEFEKHLNPQDVSPIHGDLHFSNILWKNDSTPVFLDFDDSCLGPLFQDIWMMINSETQYEYFKENYSDFHSQNMHCIWTKNLQNIFRLARMISYWNWLQVRNLDPMIQHFFPRLEETNYWENELLSWCKIVEDIF